MQWHCGTTSRLNLGTEAGQRKKLKTNQEKVDMEEAEPLTITERAAVAEFAVRLQDFNFATEAEKINMCCEIVAQVRAGATPKDLYTCYNKATPRTVYRVISRARRAGLLPPFQPILIAKARSLVTELKLGSMYALAQACGDDLLHWIVKNKPKDSTAAEFMAAILRDAMFEEEDEKNEKA
jgi:transposase